MREEIVLSLPVKNSELRELLIAKSRRSESIRSKAFR